MRLPISGRESRRVSVSFTDETKWSKGVVPAAAEPVNLGAGTSTITLPESVEYARLVSELGGARVRTW
ncbi:MAG: hypothetical protein R3F11_26400 [Verrucomicrobiales bacterium]